MAFKDVSAMGPSNKVKAKDMKIGEPLTAFVTGINSYTNKDDQKFNNLIMVGEDGGEEFELQTCGNLSYMVADGKIKVGQLTQITKTEEKNTKNKRTQFKVLQDADTTLSDLKFAALGDADEAPQAADRKASVAKATESGIKAQAEKLANSARKQ